LRLVGVTWLGTDFTAEGTLLMSTTTLSRYPLSPDPRRSPLDLVGLGIIKLAGGASREQVRQGLVAALPQQDVLVLTPEQLESKEMWFWQTATPVGFVFLLGLAVGFVVGVVICYQILATDVTDHLAEYATLKAIGYHGRFLNQVVLQQALWLSLLGFALGISLTWPLYWKLEDATGLPLQLTLLRIGLILLLTVGMCILSGLLALRRVRTLDPAEVF
jgi:putative ABC transport system permease protein